MSQYAILMREDDHAWDNLAPEQREAYMQQYQAWVEGLRERGIFQGGTPLGNGGAIVMSLDGAVVEAPFTQTKQVVTGYFLIETATWAEALEVARSCPALTHGETVELRPVGH